jgi:hypothetical protein
MAVNTVSSISADTWQLISSSSPTSGTSVSFTSISGYKTLMLAFKGVTTAASSYMIVRLNNDSTAGDYNDGVGTDTSFNISTNTSTSRAGAIIIYDVDQAVPHKVEKSSYIASDYPTPVFYTDPVAITRVDLISREASAFTAGTVYLYGIAA